MPVLIHSLEAALVVLVFTFFTRLGKAAKEEPLARSLPQKKCQQMNQNSLSVTHDQVLAGVQSDIAEDNSERELRDKLSPLQTVKSDPKGAISSAILFLNDQLSLSSRMIGLVSKLGVQTLNSVTIAFSIGGIGQIGKQHNLDADQHEALLRIALKHLQKQFELTKLSCKDALEKESHAKRSGAKAAKLWLDTDEVPNHLSLETYLKEWHNIKCA